MRLSAPIYLSLKDDPFNGTILSVREHLPPGAPARSEGPLVLLTFHPGYITGSCAEWDYFQQLAQNLFAWAGDDRRLRVFTVNHPGYNYPRGAAVDRYSLEPYSIRHQPQAMEAALAWLLEDHLEREEEIMWIAYGHSMGGLALSLYRPDALITRLAGAGCRLHLTKILSAPAFCLHPKARAIISQLDVLHMLKHTVGRLPLYAPVATGLFRAFAPFFYRLSADGFSIGALQGFREFRQLDPFVLLEQGRELLRYEAAAMCEPAALDGVHVLLAQRDGMIDAPATLAWIETARQQGHQVTRHDIDSTHLLELDAPEAAATIIQQVIEAARRDPI
jgi:pimeloyl-ACP methyl ester carboxylesterase